MAIYNIIYILTLLGIFIGFSRKSRLINVCYIAASAIIILSVALRAENIGADTYNYLTHFKNPSNPAGYYYGKVESGYLGFVYVIKFLNDNKYFFLFLTALLPYTAILYFGKKYAPNTMLFLFLLLSFSIGASLYILSFSMIRQVLAIGIWAIVLHLYISNDYRFNKYVIITIIVMVSFHTSSLLGVILLGLDKVHLSKKVMIISCILAYCAGLLMATIFPYIQRLAMLIGGEFYLTSRMGELAFNPFALLPYMGIFFLILFYNSTEYCNSIFVKGLFVSIIVSGILYSIGTNLDRINMYFYLPAFIAVSDIFRKPKPLIKYTVLAAFLIYFSYKYYFAIDATYIPLAPLVPYRSFLS